MYLSTRQHDSLQILVTAFEIPFRTYIAETILDSFPREDEFIAALAAKVSYPNINNCYAAINSELGKLKANPSRIFQCLKNAKLTKTKKVVEEEVDVPLVGQLITLLFVFRDLFSTLMIEFADESSFLNQAFKYKYVRNKLDHRGCKTLEESDMIVSLDFISSTLLLLKDDDSLFWEKPYEEINQRVYSLQTSKAEIPIPVNNINMMPFPDMKIVCRGREIGELKDFVYGKPGALRKPSSFVLFGYGGVGKTALVLETVKQIVQDIQDNNTINDYRPFFVLFFTAKENKLSFSTTTGKLQNEKNKASFGTAEELFTSIYQALGITSFSGYDKAGLIVIDNLESLTIDDRKKVEEFIRFASPYQVQYIITSRNEENYEIRKKLAGFENDIEGEEFIDAYTSENGYELELSSYDKQTLLRIAMGNTLVLVLCLRRLSLNITTIPGIVTDMNAPVTIRKLEKEAETIPPNGFAIISEFMFKNSFQEIQEKYNSNSSLMASILQVFAVSSDEPIDQYTISMLINQPYSVIDPILELLCRYLIVEKIGESYQINPFAEKYIVQLFMPDPDTNKRIYEEISASKSKIRDELFSLQKSVDSNSELRRIMQDWCIIANGDRIAAAKAFRIYHDAEIDCKRDSKFHAESLLEEAINAIETIEKNTMHPYFKYQKARILQLISDTGILRVDFSSQIEQAYNDTIWSIHSNHLYSSIKNTKSYASVLWKFGILLFNQDGIGKLQMAIKNLNEARQTFIRLKDNSEDFDQCSILLGRAYLRFYETDRKQNISYLRKAKAIYHETKNGKAFFSKKVHRQLMTFKNTLNTYDRSVN